MKIHSMCSWLIIVAVLGIMLILTLSGQAAQTRTLSAVVIADDMTWKWEENLFEFVGNCQLEITGPHQATMTTPRLSFKLTKTTSGEQVIEQLQASGPIHFTLVTAPDREGQQRRMVGTASQGATYSEVTSKVVLTGGARIDSVTLPEGPQSERISFSAEALTINLKTSTLAASKGRLKFTTPLEESTSASGESS